MPTTLEVAQALADALVDVSPQDGYVVEPFMVFAPGGPCIDVYPSDPAEEDLAFGHGTATLWWTIRLRVETMDSEGQQAFLYGARDQIGPTSVRAALLADETLGGVVDSLMVGRPTGFQLYEDSPGSGSLRYLGQEWRVGTHVSAGPDS